MKPQDFARLTLDKDKPQDYTRLTQKNKEESCGNLWLKITEPRIKK